MYEEQTWALYQYDTETPHDVRLWQGNQVEFHTKAWTAFSTISIDWLKWWSYMHHNQVNIYESPLGFIQCWMSRRHCDFSSITYHYRWASSGSCHGKPKYAFTFGDLCKSFVNHVRRIAYKFSRADIVFDRFRQHSVKNYTRQKRSATYIPIRRVIDKPGFALPQNYKNFIALPDNKADFALFLPNSIV